MGRRHQRDFVAVCGVAILSGGMLVGMSKHRASGERDKDMVHADRQVLRADRQLLREAEAVCVEAVHNVGTILRDYFRAPLTVEFKEKGQESPVTEADRRSEESLRAVLTRAFPTHGIIGEEGEAVVNPGAEYVWFLDPLDGTTNFTAGLPAFAISMGLCFRGTPVLGVVAIPWEGPKGTIFRAYQGGGAHCNDTPIQIAPADVPSGTRLMSTPFGVMWQYRIRRRSAVWQSNIRGSGSIAYELVYAARGTFQLSIISGAHLWDMVAGALLIQEAGGSVLYCNGTSRRWSTWDTFLQRALSSPFGQDVEALRKLVVYMLVGNPDIVQQEASRIRLRRSFPAIAKAKRQVRKVWKRLTSPTPRPPSSPEASAS